VDFQVFGDGQDICLDSGLMGANGGPKRIDVPIEGVQILGLAAVGAGKGSAWDHADWADPTCLVSNLAPGFQTREPHTGVKGKTPWKCSFDGKRTSVRPQDSKVRRGVPHRCRFGD